MFKNASCTDEVLQSMEKNLIANKTEEKFVFNKLAKTINYLNSAASIFERAGMYAEAEAIVKVIESLGSK